MQVYMDATGNKKRKTRNQNFTAAKRHGIINIDRYSCSKLSFSQPLVHSVFLVKPCIDFEEFVKSQLNDRFNSIYPRSNIYKFLGILSSINSHTPTRTNQERGKSERVTEELKDFE